MKRLLAGAMLALLVALPAQAAADTCLEHPYSGKSRLAADIAAAREMIQPFPTLRDTIDALRPRICATEDASEALGTFGAEEGIITVNAALPAERRIAVLLHEMRHLDQFARGYCHSTSLDMRSNARAVFALEADAMAITHLIAWVSQRDGKARLFDALKGSPETADIAAAFEREMAASADVSFATAAAFDAWYGSELRRERYYVSTCMAYLDRIEEAHLFAGTERLPDEFLEDVCRMPDRKAYPCDEPENPLPR